MKNAIIRAITILSIFITFSGYSQVSTKAGQDSTKAAIERVKGSLYRIEAGIGTQSVTIKNPSLTILNPSVTVSNPSLSVYNNKSDSTNNKLDRIARALFDSGSGLYLMGWITDIDNILGGINSKLGGNLTVSPFQTITQLTVSGTTSASATYTVGSVILPDTNGSTGNIPLSLGKANTPFELVSAYAVSNNTAASVPSHCMIFGSSFSAGTNTTVFAPSYSNFSTLRASFDFVQQTSVPASLSGVYVSQTSLNGGQNPVLKTDGSGKLFMIVTSTSAYTSPANQQWTWIFNFKQAQ